MKGAVTKLQTSSIGGFYSTLFLVPKKDSGVRPVINLKQLNAFMEATTHQNGGDSNPQKPSETRRLVGQCRHMRCIFLHPDQLGTQQISVLRCREQHLPIQLLPIGPGLSPMGL